MPEDVDLNGIITQLSEEFDALIDEREDIRMKSEHLKKRSEEIARKIAGIQQTLHGFHSYMQAHEAPTELNKKIEKRVEGVLADLTRHAAIFSNPLKVLTEGGTVTVDAPKTLSECCRDILRRNGGLMSAVQVRDALLAAGFDFSKYTSNPLTSIHTTLKRLVPEELENEATPDGQMYRWKVAGKK